MARYAKSVGRNVMLVGSCSDHLKCNFVDLMLFMEAATANQPDGSTVWPALRQEYVGQF